MNTSIRSYIINNFKNDKKEELRKAIEGSIKEKDEETLPGEGVFLELLWESADNELKDKILDIIMKRLDKEKSDS